MAQRTPITLHGTDQVFCVEEFDGEFQAVYPECYAEDYGAIYDSESAAWDAIDEAIAELGLTVVNGVAYPKTQG